jgi:DNA-binding transcriptional ArsR family regulator
VKQYFVIDTPEKLKAISDPLRIRLIMMIVQEEATGKQLADRLEMSASKVHYHLRELEQHGFIEVVRTEEKNGIMQKFYRISALDFVVSEDLLPSLHGETELLQEILVGQLRMAIQRVYEAPQSSFTSEASGSASAPTIQGVWEVKAPREEIRKWLKKYRALTDELREMEQEYRRQIEADPAEDTGEVFFFVNVGFMTNVERFHAEHQTMPDGCEITSHSPEGDFIASRVIKSASQRTSQQTSPQSRTMNPEQGNS